MTPVEYLVVVAALAVTVPMLAAAGAGGGYLLSVSELFQDAQERWRRNADLLDAALHGELIGWEEAWQANPDPTVSPIPWGMVEGDTKVLPELAIEPDRRQRARWRAKWVWYAMLRCNICSGWHVIEALGVWTGVGLWLLGFPWQLLVLVAPVVWLASGWMHTRWSGEANKREVL